MQRYFIDDTSGKVDIEKKTIIIKSDDVHHIRNVMRMIIGEQIIVCYQDKSYLCQIDVIMVNEVKLSIIKELIENCELPCQVTIAQGLIRKEKMEEVIDHITELGASFYLPVLMKRSTVKLTSEKLENKITRLNKIAKEAAEQSHRIKKLKVLEPISLKELIKNSSSYDLKLFAHVNSEPSFYIGDVILEANNILILVGPEGGFDNEEVEILKKAGFMMVSLGKRVLRTEVAPSYIMSIIDMLRGNKNEI